MPDIEIVSDFIVGFPGETDDDFQDTVSLLKEARFVNSFVFKYSERPGTKASKFEDDVLYNVKQERNKILLDIQSEISQEKNKQLIGKTVQVLGEGVSKNNPDTQVGRTKQNHIVIFQSDGDMSGKLLNIKIKTATAFTLIGDISV